MPLEVGKTGGFWPTPQDQIIQRQRRIPQFPPVQLPPQRAAYANEVVVERGEHDALMKFYCVRGDSRSLVTEITVPLGAISSLI